MSHLVWAHSVGFVYLPTIRDAPLGGWQQVRDKTSRIWGTRKIPLGVLITELGVTQYHPLTEKLIFLCKTTWPDMNWGTERGWWWRIRASKQVSKL